MNTILLKNVKKYKRVPVPIQPTTRTPRVKKEKEKEYKKVDYTVHDFMTRTSVEKVFITSGSREIKISIDSKIVKSSHNILGWWEAIPSNFIITFTSDTNDSYKRVEIRHPLDPEYKIIIESPSILLIAWKHEPTIV